MKLFSYGKDGGAKSNVYGFWLIELKSLFSIVILKFDLGSREVFHNHAFNAVTWFIHGEIEEHHLDGRVLNWKPSLIPKVTPKTCFHKVYGIKTTYAVSFRGSWNTTWKEQRGNKTVTLKWGRQEISKEGK